jgi:hypothetical protein
LGSGFTGYMSDVGNTSFSYSQLNGGDGFLLQITLDSSANVDTGASQLGCGIAVGSTQPYVYAVCAN